MILKTFLKQPKEHKDYDVDYVPWLTPMLDSIQSLDVAVVCITDPSDTTLVVTEAMHTIDRCKVWVDGGTATYQYKITLKVTTEGGRIDESELIFAIEEF